MTFYRLNACAPNSYVKSFCGVGLLRYNYFIHCPQKWNYFLYKKASESLMYSKKISFNESENRSSPDMESASTYIV